MKLTIIILLIICSLICYSACAVPKSVEEQRQDDEAQLEWINKYKRVSGEAIKHAEENNVILNIGTLRRDTF